MPSGTPRRFAETRGLNRALGFVFETENPRALIWPGDRVASKKSVTAPGAVPRIAASLSWLNRIHLGLSLVSLRFDREA